MKKETQIIERTVKEEKTFIYADDGTLFQSEEECKKYEEGAAFACKVRIKDCLIQIEDDSAFKELFMDGCGEDYDTFIFRPKTEEDVKTFLQWTKVTKVPLRTLSEVKDKEWFKYSKYLCAEEIQPNQVYIVFHYENTWCGVTALDVDSGLGKVIKFIKEIINNL